MKKPLLLLSVLIVLLLCSCTITITPGPTVKPSAAFPAERPTQAPTPDPAPDPTPDSKATDEPMTENSGGLLGEVEGSTYVNKVFGFSAAIPEEWQVATEDELSTLFGISSDYMKETTSLEPGTETYIFYCSEYGIGYPGLSANINIVVSNKQDTLMLLKSQSAFDYFIEAYGPMLKQLYGGSEVEISGEMGVEIGGKKYSVVHIRSEFNGAPIIQEQYFTELKDNALTITFTFNDDSYMPVAKEFIDSLKYE